ncbi:MAG: hypothetical protein Q8M29_13490 [Bacteroidota bacterium]|nr:hypothetical protein [Bacteroidota bacterium]
MRKHIKHFLNLSIILIIQLNTSSIVFGQNKIHLDKYINGIEYIKKNTEVTKYRNNYYDRKSVKFRVSENIISNYKPLSYLKNQTDKIEITQNQIDSLVTLKKDSALTIPSLTKYTVDPKANYILYFGKPYRNTLLTVIEYSSSKEKDSKYDGLGNHPFIILLVFDSENKVKTALFASPIFD